jgi:SH2 domain
MLEMKCLFYDARLFSKDWAEARLRDRHGRDGSFNYLLRQSEKDFDGFTLVYIASQKPVCVQIKRNDKGYYLLLDKEGTEPQFMSVAELIEHYRRTGQDGKSIALNKCVLPANPCKC